MVNGWAPFCHDLLQVTIGERVSQIPANAGEDDHVFEVPPAEQCWWFSGHDTLWFPQTRISLRARALDILS
jgi:hypothetical protein